MNYSLLTSFEPDAETGPPESRKLKNNVSLQNLYQFKPRITMITNYINPH